MCSGDCRRRDAGVDAQRAAGDMAAGRCDGAELHAALAGKQAGLADDYKGKWVVLYFYPKDQTSGCTIEAHNFQRDLAKYEALNAVVLGVSLDTVESHKTWCTKDCSPSSCWPIPDHKVVDAYGVPVKTSSWRR